MNNKMKTNWNNFVLGESELECKSIEDAEMLLNVCIEHDIDCNYIAPDDWKHEPYWYVKHNSLEITAYSLENDDICDCWIVKDYIENHTYSVEETKEKENKKYRIDCSMIRHVRLPHEQFVAIKNKAKCLIVEDRDKGDCISFERITPDVELASFNIENKKAYEENYDSFPVVDEYSDEKILEWIKNHNKYFQ